MMFYDPQPFVLGGAPGAGKGTNTGFIAQARGLTCEPIVISALLDTPEAKRLKDGGNMVGDREVIGLLLRRLLRLWLRLRQRPLPRPLRQWWLRWWMTARVHNRWLHRWRLRRFRCSRMHSLPRLRHLPFEWSPVPALSQVQAVHIPCYRRTAITS